MYIVMAPIEKRAEKKTENGEADTSANAGDTIGDAIAAKAPTPQAAAEAPAQQGP
jgi:hypothetical protein